MLFIFAGRRSVYRPRMDNSSHHQEPPNMKIIMDSLRVIRNQLAVLRIYLPAIFTFSVLTLCLTLFLHHLQNPSSVFISIDNLTGRSGRAVNATGQNWDGVERALIENFNGFSSYSDLVSKKNRMTNKQSCEYGSIWQTTQYLQVSCSYFVRF